jgi:pseudaminic acid cytidylyltransferase
MSNKTRGLPGFERRGSSSQTPASRVAVIPARGGSKRLPGKNSRDFFGKPVIAYPIEAARRSHLFDRIVVSTDCSVIASTALSLGAEVPFRRPAELASDHCGTLEVFRHALQFLDAEQDEPIAFACCIYPTAVLATETHLVRAFQALSTSPEYQYCITVAEYHHPIQRSLRIADDGSVAPVRPEYSLTRSQDLKPHYFDAGQFYWGTGAAIRTGVPIFAGKSLPYILGSHEFVDINTSADWKLAEAIARGLIATDSQETRRCGDLTTAEPIKLRCPSTSEVTISATSSLKLTSAD